MKITQLYTYPIKSLREVPLTSAEVTKHGFPYDRRFMIFKVTRHDPSATPPYTLDCMTITYYPAMTLFRQEILSQPPSSERGRDESLVRITYEAPGGGGGGGGGRRSQIEIPLRPELQHLEALEIELHRSPTKAYIMDAKYNDWFSAQFGYETMLVHLGPHLRPVLGNLAPAKQNASAWFASVARQLPLLGSAFAPAAEEGLTFTDVAAYLVVTEESLADVSGRLSGMEADMTKFRPNIVLAGAKAAYEEDFWAQLSIGLEGGAEKEKEEKRDPSVVLDLTQNCARCNSLNIDYATGEFGKGEVGSVLKKMMKDRRVDQGTKYSPIFGRYGFLSSASGQMIAVGDEVEVLRRNGERTTFVWPGLGS